MFETDENSLFRNPGEKAISGISGHDIIGFLRHFFRNANLQRPGISPEKAKDEIFWNNETFWNGFLDQNPLYFFGFPRMDDPMDERLLFANPVRFRRYGSDGVRVPVFKWVYLEGFSLIDWFPRSPGIFHTAQAQAARYAARKQMVRVGDEAYYDPYGKRNMVQQGGFGSLRFKPIKIDGIDCWLYTATSDAYCHTGIPLAIPNTLLEKISFDLRSKFQIVGQIRFLPDFLEKHFYDQIHVRQIYVLVDKLERLAQPSSSVLITPTILFNINLDKILTDKFRGSNDWSPNYGVCYASSLPENLNHAISWIENYVSMYGNDILTNFDQQSPTFSGVPFSIQNIMTGNINVDELRKLEIEQAYFISNSIKDIYIKAADMSKHIDIRISDEGKLQIQGDLINADTITNSFNKAGQIEDNSLKNLMQELVVAVGKMSALLAEDEQAEVARNLEILVAESAKEKPSKRWWEFSIEGLKKAAENVGAIGKPVIELAGKIGLILAALPH